MGRKAEKCQGVGGNETKDLGQMDAKEERVLTVFDVICGEAFRAKVLLRKGRM